MHAATDTEQAWAFYKELTGQYNDGHSVQGVPDAISWQSDVLNHPAVVGLPNPWALNTEWWYFNDHASWSALPGFMILGRRQSDNQPVSFAREHDNYRSFYTALGHESALYQDENFKQHLTGGIMWAVRREHLLQ